MHYANGRFSLTKADLAALLAFASKDATRLSLSSIYFEPAKGRCVATDGHTLVTVDAPGLAENIATAPAPFTLNRDDLEQAKRWLSKRDHVLYVACPADDGPAYLWAVERTSRDSGYTYREHIVSERDCTRAAGEYPPYEQVIPYRDYVGLSISAIGVSAKYLTRLGLIEKATGACGSVIRMPERSLDPIVATVSAHDGTEWRAVFMPIRMDDLPTSVADILAECQPRKAA